MAGIAVLAACGGGAGNPPATPTEVRPPNTPVATQSAPAPTATPETPGTPAEHPPSLITNLEVRVNSATEVVISFSYHLELNPEQTAFVHLGRLPPLSVRMLDAEGAPIGATIAGELVPTEFGTTTVGGTATLAADDARADDIAAIFICIEVWTGGGGASLLEDPNFGLLDEICEPFPVEVEAAS